MHFNTINPNIKEIIKRSTNNYIKSNTLSKYKSYSIPEQNILYLPLVSLISFLAGYKFHKLIN